MKLQGRKIYPGNARGEALVSTQAISFFGGVDPESGMVVERGHELEGQSIAGKVLVFPTGKGSTVGSYTLYRLKPKRKPRSRSSMLSARRSPRWAASLPRSLAWIEWI